MEFYQRKCWNKISSHWNPTSLSYGQKRHVSNVGTPHSESVWTVGMTLRAKDIPLNEFPCALKTEQKINHKTNISKSEDVLSLTHLERKRLAPGFLIYHSQYKYWVPTPSWMLLVCTTYSIRDYRFNSLVTAQEFGVRFCQTSHTANQNRKIPFQITLDTGMKNSPLS